MKLGRVLGMQRRVLVLPVNLLKRSISVEEY